MLLAAGEPDHARWTRGPGGRPAQAVPPRAAPGGGLVCGGRRAADNAAVLAAHRIAGRSERVLMLDKAEGGVACALRSGSARAQICCNCSTAAARSPTSSSGARPGWACAGRSRGARCCPARRCARACLVEAPASRASPRRFRAGACQRCAGRRARPSCSPRPPAGGGRGRARAVPPTPTRRSKGLAAAGGRLGACRRVPCPWPAGRCGLLPQPRRAGASPYVAFHSPGWARSSATISPAACSSLCRRPPRCRGGLPAPGDHPARAGVMRA